MEVPLFTVNMPKSVDKPLLDVLHSGYIAQGVKVDEFEEKFGDVLGHRNVASVNSGTSALTLALRLAGVGPGDEVITTPMTCSATNLPIISLGAKPVLADILYHSGLIDPSSVRALITPKTKAIMAVDWGGAPVDVAALNKLAAKNIKVIVDAAHAIGAAHNAEPDFLCYSLQAIKHMTTVDGGVLVCRDKQDHSQAKKLRWFGIDRESGAGDDRINEDIVDWGYKFHMNDVAATIGLAQLDFVTEIVSAHRANAEYYDKHISDLSDFYIKPALEGSHWLYTLLLPDKKLRDEFKAYMSQRGVQVSQVHRRNDEYTIFKPYARKLPGVDYFSERMICIPVHSSLSHQDRSYIVKACNEFEAAQL